MKKLKWLKRVILGILLVFILMFIGFNFLIAYNYSAQITNLVPREQTVKNKESFLKEQDEEYISFKNEHNIQSVTVKSSKASHEIPVMYISTEESKGHVILIHGLGGTKETVFPVAKMFIKMGYSVVIYDQRNSGENKAPSNTFGLKESEDLIDVTQYVQKEFNSKQTIIWGESFGGATAAFASDDLSQTVDYMILDSPMSDGVKQINKEVKPISESTGIPLDYLNFLGDVGLKVREGIGFNQLNVADEIKDSTIPLLVLHNRKDSIVDFEDGVSLYKSSGADQKEFFEIKDSNHTEFIMDHPEKYQRIVEGFIK